MTLEEAKEELEHFIIAKLDNIDLKEAIRIVLKTLNDNAL